MVSIIVPNYNHAAYLKERINSILSQTYTDFELILLDDCSSDNSREILSTYKSNPKVSHVVFNAHNSGSTFVQWEKGISISKGEYIWIAESDDVAAPTFLEECMKRLHSSEDVLLAYTYSTYIDSYGAPMSISIDEPQKFRAPGLYNAREFCRRRMLYKNITYNASMIVFRKSALRFVTPFYKSFRYCGDWSFWFDLLWASGDPKANSRLVAEVPLKLNKYRQHPQKVSTHATAVGLDFYENAKCQQRISKILSLSNYQKMCLRGRLTKRFTKASFEGKENIRKEFPDLYGGNLFDIIIYELDKLTCWSGFSH